MMLRRLFWYGLVGASGVVVNLAVLTAIHWMAPQLKTLDSLVAVEASIVPNYLLNARFTFHNRVSWKAFGQYNLVMAGAEIIQVVIARYLMSRGMDYRLSQIIAIPFGTAFGFLFSSFWVFRKQEASTDANVSRSGTKPRPHTEGNR